jgi:hypothetical protein
MFITERAEEQQGQRTLAGWQAGTAVAKSAEAPADGD